MADTGPLKGPDPWAHIRAHAAEGGLYACAIEALLERIQHLEARPEVQVLPTTPKACGPTLLAPVQLQQGADDAPVGSLLELVVEAIVDGMVISDQRAAELAILAIADWFTKKEWHLTSGALREEVERHG